MASSNRRSVLAFLWMQTLLAIYPHNSSGLSYEELVSDIDPIIPHEVRLEGNVTVTRGANGMVSFSFKGLPNHPTMMVNRNEAVAVDFQVDLPEDPVPMDEHTCLTGGPIGWTIHGVSLYNPFNAFGSNAVEGDEAEAFDECQGHPDPNGIYHYHQLPDNCVFQDIDTSVHGIARDGFPIYGPYKEDGTELQESDLDKCHGRCGDDGKYRYHMTKTFPYIMGCFRGTPMEFTASGGGGGGGEGGGQRPPPSGDGGPPPGDGGERPPRPSRKRRQDPNQCAFNTVTGSNYEFKTCSGLSDNNNPPIGNDDNGSTRAEFTFSLNLALCFVACFFSNVLIGLETRLFRLIYL